MNQYDQDALGLSPAQASIVRHILAGKCDKRIARDTGLARSTIKAHAVAARRKLGVNGGRAELIARVAELVDVDLIARFDALRRAA